MNWFKIGKCIHEGCILSLCLYAEDIIWNAKLDESQAGVKISGRNIINNPIYADNTTLTVESEEELKGWSEAKEAKQELLEGERGDWKGWLKTQ